MSRLAQQIRQKIVEPAIEQTPLPTVGKLISINGNGTLAHIQIVTEEGVAVDYYKATMLAQPLQGLHGRTPMDILVQLIWPGRNRSQDPWIVGFVYPNDRDRSTLWARRPPF